MAGFALFFFLPLSFSLLLLQFQLTTAQTFIYLHGSDHYSPTANRTYDTNLHLLLSSISNNITGNNTSFYTNTVGRSDTVYGVFQCRGDIGAEDCKKCAQIASADMIVRCPYMKQIYIWYDECWLHYSNNHTISTMLSQPTFHFNWGNDVSYENHQFMPRLNELLNELVAQAVHNKSLNLFALGTKNVTNSQTIYGLVQCTQDVSRRDCDRCLKEAVAEIPVCCDHKDGVRVLKPSCIVWYEVYDFFEYDYFTAIHPPSNSKTTPRSELSRTALIIAVVLTITVVVFLSIIVIFFYLRKNHEIGIANDSEGISVESLQFKLGTVLTATDNFNDANKLGEGGFGAVYKGNLSSGRKIAVKRLAANSIQGADEFKNEILMLAKLQHRNLVRLLGFCLERKEKLLIYEYVANASLDHFLFDTIKSTFLDWERRYNIIGGIARGLLYLHQESRERVIHRDLKASNVLLDTEMNPKISDFGIARLFSGDQTHVTTNNVVGTHGYMAPEYALQGHFSVKSDVFSFGVLVLEIVTGQQNSSFHRGEPVEDLLGYAWRQWEEGTLLELLDPTLRERCSRTEVMRCVHIGLLCVQEDAAKRPTMESVLLMLSSDSFSLTLPSPPPILVGKRMEGNIIEMDDGKHTTQSPNQLP